MLQLKIPALRAFVAVVDEGGIQAAGNRVGLSPSAVSMTLRQIEDHLGGALFEPGRKQHLTELGRVALEIARTEVARYQRAMSTLESFSRGESGRIDIACVPSVALNILPAVIHAFTERWPHVRLDLQDADTRSVVNAVRAGDADIGIAGRPAAPDGIEFERLFFDELVLVCPESMSIAPGRTEIDWADLRGLRLIANGLSSALTHPRAVELHTGANLMVRNTTSLLAMVQGGVGVTLLPRISVPNDQAGVRALSFRGSELMREVGLIRRAGVTRSPVVRNFTGLLSGYVARNTDADQKLNTTQGRDDGSRS